ncbi:MAG TPA: TolC family protein, partial [Burkholderiales bacterium]|nr:TolC family protein [Burkholderiales bacterium]
MKTIFSLSLMTIALTGCSLAPDFEQPAIDVPQAYKEAAQLPENEKGAWKEAQPNETAERGEWWRLFNDEGLNAIETQAIAANPQLLAAAARLRQARAIVDVVNADRLPQVGAFAGVNRQKPTGALLNI